MSKTILFNILAWIICSNSFGFLVADEYQHLVELSKSDAILGLEGGELSRLNLVYDKCSSFPFYGLSKNGIQKINSSFLYSLQTAHQFLVSYESQLAPFVLDKFSHLANTLRDDSKRKTFHCRFGETNSFIAIATTSESDESIEKYSMANYPSIIFDTNRMAGNFPFDVNPDNFRAFYGAKLDGVEVKAGVRNPFYAKTNNPSSLIFHEMFHWTGEKHFNKTYVDVIYLVQFCLFSHDNINDELATKSCDLLKDKSLWQEEESARIEYIEKNRVRDFVSKLKKLYHSHF